MAKVKSTADSLYLVTQESPHSEIAESVRSIRTRLLFSSPDTQLQTLLITSSHPHEGKTFTSVNLSIVMTQLGKKVLLVEADMRKPSFTKIFSLGSVGESVGLSNLIMRRVNLEEVVMKLPQNENLNVIPCGPKPPNPAELLGSKSMDMLLNELKSKYDMIILDCPPIHGLADTMTLAPKVDGSILVIRHRKTSIRNAMKSKEAILSVGGKIIGVILEMVKPEPFGHFHYARKYSYYYSYQQEKDQDIKKM